MSKEMKLVNKVAQDIFAGCHYKSDNGEIWVKFPGDHKSVTHLIKEIATKTIKTKGEE